MKISKQPARNPVRGNQGWENENDPTLAPSILGIHGGRAGQFTKHAITLPEEGNKQNAITKVRALNRVLIGEFLFYKIQLGEETNGEEGKEQWQH